MEKFEYFCPPTLRDALGLLERHSNDAKPLAGGTDLFLRMERRVAMPRFLVDLKKIPDLGRIRPADGGLRLGALTLMDDIVRSPEIIAERRMLREAAGAVGSLQTRNRATLGGNLCNASPAADTAPPLLALQARARIASARGEREIPIETLFLGAGKNSLSPDELLKEIVLAPIRPHTGGSFQRCTRTGMDIALVNCAVFLGLDQPGGAVDEVRIALGAVAATPVRSPRAEGVLRGEKPTKKRIEEAAAEAASDVHPIDDVRSTAAYRLSVVRVLTRRAIEEALKEASDGG
jgi:carbon-monoxide dehydrogenase medium subunit